MICIVRKQNPDFRYLTKFFLNAPFEFFIFICIFKINGLVCLELPKKLTVR